MPEVISRWERKEFTFLYSDGHGNVLTGYGVRFTALVFGELRSVVINGPTPWEVYGPVGAFIAQREFQDKANWMRWAHCEAEAIKLGERIGGEALIAHNPGIQRTH